MFSQGLRHAIRLNIVSEYFTHKKHFKKNFAIEEKLDFSNFLSLVLIIKNEASYIEEWINYHRIVGVNKFYIYDNESTDNLKKILQPYIKSNLVDYTYWTGQKQQKIVYNDALKKHRLDTKWLGFIDSDEFLVPVSKKTLPDVIKEINPKYGLQVHWVFYGSNGHIKRSSGLVIERFTKRAANDYYPNHICKSIVNPRIIYYQTEHSGYFIGNNFSIDEQGKKCGMGGNITFEKIRCNHYYTKSKEEYLNKINRGDAIYGTSLTSMNIFDSIDKDRNEITDNIMKKYVPLVKKAIASHHKKK
ncbi:MAG: glycosyltransferase family 92 protein [Rickettsiales bacterium]|nr:glycosyltransferase family 92 protein [Rickettsiales bacterium]